MKKFLVCVVMIMIVISTGCGKVEKNTETKAIKNPLKTSGTLVCTKSETDDDGLLTNERVTIKYKHNMVKNIDSESIIEADADYMDFTLGLASSISEVFNEIDGLKYDISKVDDTHIKANISVDIDKLDLDKLSELSEDGTNISLFDKLKAKNLTIDTCKKEMFNGYECK